MLPEGYRRIMIIDDEGNMRAALRRLFVNQGYQVESFESGAEFLAQGGMDRPGCVILDLHMPGPDGLAVQTELNRRGCELPLIFLTGSAAVRNAVDAMRAGATDFLEKPFDNEDLLRRVEAALRGYQATREARDLRVAVGARLARLTPREAQVLELVARGLTNKEVARELGSSHRTVETQRTRIMEKTEAQSLADLVRMLMLVAQ